MKDLLNLEEAQANENLRKAALATVAQQADLIILLTERLVEHEGLQTSHEQLEDEVIALRCQAAELSEQQQEARVDLGLEQLDRAVKAEANLVECEANRAEVARRNVELGNERDRARTELAEFKKTSLNMEAVAFMLDRYYVQSDWGAVGIVYLWSGQGWVMEVLLPDESTHKPWSTYPLIQNAELKFGSAEVQGAIVQKMLHAHNDALALSARYAEDIAPSRMNLLSDRALRRRVHEWLHTVSSGSSVNMPKSEFEASLAKAILEHTVRVYAHDLQQGPNERYEHA